MNFPGIHERRPSAGRRKLFCVYSLLIPESQLVDTINHCWLMDDDWRRKRVCVCVCAQKRERHSESKWERKEKEVNRKKSAREKLNEMKWVWKGKLKGQVEFSGSAVWLRPERLWGNEISGFRLMLNVNSYNNTAVSYETRLSGVTSGLATAISSAVSQMLYSLQWPHLTTHTHMHAHTHTHTHTHTHHFPSMTLI